MTDPNKKPEKTWFEVVQSRVALLASVATLAVLAYSYATDRINTSRDVEDLKEDYDEIQEGQKELFGKLRSFRALLNQEVRDLTAEINELNINLTRIRNYADSEDK